VPEGHSVHRIARQFAANFVGQFVAASSPQGRFVDGAARVSGHQMVDAFAVGKQMFLEFETGDWIRVHLGIYGAWDFSGQIDMDATIASANGSMGQTNMRGTVLDEAGEDSLASIGAPRRARVRMGEQTSYGRLSSAQRDRRLNSAEDAYRNPADSFPPEPVGAVRLRLFTDLVCADLRGPTACDLLDVTEVAAVIAKLGPDPARDKSKAAEARFVTTVTAKPTPIGQLLMDQSVVAGIGNVYRAEMLFRAGITPYRPGKLITTDEASALWRDWVKLLAIGIETGQMMTRDGLRGKALRDALARRDDRHWVYKREGLPCRKCGTAIALEVMATRKLYWCPSCQV
jgi:formamidopyrimidine-DNA glycosylase